jgi:hypothetical protein
MIMSIGLIYSRDRGTGFAVAGACMSMLLGAILVLATTGLWENHLQIVYVAAVVGVLGLAPLLNQAAQKSRLLTLGIVIGAAHLLSGAPAYGSYVEGIRAFSPHSLAELSPEARALLRSGDSGSYARVGTNDDSGHAIGLRSWKLKCARFHQYYFDPPELLNSVFDCVATAPNVIVSEGFSEEKPSLPWRQFQGRVERLLADHYSCDGGSGPRICKRRDAGSPR